jgi:hypothetical protein
MIGWSIGCLIYGFRKNRIQGLAKNVLLILMKSCGAAASTPSVPGTDAGRFWHYVYVKSGKDRV